ncbi:MAG TPA: hypothetical protein VHZ78_03690 [Rhizomicrobium sp.]|jgi:hypothetical protein|nr:hypothetical protein [Rhizomicrobium sp.]
MQDLSQSTPTAPRSLRVGIGARALAGGGVRRTLRGRKTVASNTWRRCEMGTNHIACFGVWRRGTRRQVVRNARPGTTRWHMPHPDDAAFVLRGAEGEIAYQD